MICKNCKKEHDGSYGTGIFCCEDCKQRYNLSNSKKYHVCKFCGKVFEKSVSLGGHVVNCKKNPKGGLSRKNAQMTLNKNYNIRNPLKKYTLKCPVCGNDFTIEVRQKDFEKGNYKHTCSSKCSHTRQMTDEIKNKISKKIKSYINKNGSCGVVKNIIEPILLKRICDQCGNEFEIWNDKPYNKTVTGNDYYSKRFCSKECSFKHMKKLVSKSTKDRCNRGEFGGKNNETYKKHKHGWYNGLYCGSSWELAFVLYHLDKGDNIKRCELKLQYEYNGKIYNYYPDFEIGNDIYEVKGFEDFKAKAKHKQYPYIKWINKKRMKPILKYVNKKYGKNFIDLLQNKK